MKPGEKKYRIWAEAALHVFRARAIMKHPFMQGNGGKDLKTMNVIHTALLGIIQGLAEFLPISSSGHLEVAQRLMGMQADSMSMRKGFSMR